LEIIKRRLPLQPLNEKRVQLKSWGVRVDCLQPDKSVRFFRIGEKNEDKIKDRSRHQLKERKNEKKVLKIFGKLETLHNFAPR